MGTLSKMMAEGRGPRPKRGSNKDPLRKIVGWYRAESGVRIEQLECGHEQGEKHDLMGPTNAVRRRCWQCAAEPAKGE